MEKIYSRKIIKIPKMNKINKLKIFVFLIILIVVIASLIFVLAAYPIFESSCKNRAGAIAINITSNEVNKVMGNYQYEDLVQIEKDANGDVTMIKAKIVPINEMISQITSNIKNEIDETEQALVQINMGAISGVSMLSKIGPKFNIKMECSGNVKTNLLSEFSAVGINQSLHRIYLDLTTTINILTPFNIIRNEYPNKILLTESIIVGKVPETYYYYDDILQDDVLDTN